MKLQRMPSGRLGRTASGRRARCGGEIPCFPDSMFPNPRIDYAITGFVVGCSGATVNIIPTASFVIRAGACECVGQAVPVVPWFGSEELRVTYWWGGDRINAVATIWGGAFRLYFVGVSYGVRFDTRTNF